MILFINTTDSEGGEVALVDRKQTVRLRWRGRNRSSEQLLSSIRKLLMRLHAGLFDLESIAVVRGPGSFTGIRTGIVTANTLGWVLSVPVRGVQKSCALANLRERTARFRSAGQFALPFYAAPPHITKPKSRFGNMRRRV